MILMMRLYATIAIQVEGLHGGCGRRLRQPGEEAWRIEGHIFVKQNAA
jgi:hypothetical protein